MNNDAKRMLERARIRKVEFEEHIKTLDKDLETETRQLLMEKETRVASWAVDVDNDEKENSDSPTKNNLRNVVKLKLDKLGKLYAGEEVSSPIHRSTENEYMSPLVHAHNTGKLSQARSARLAALANTINNWEDDLTCSKKPSPTKGPQAKPKILGDRNVKKSDVIKPHLNINKVLPSPAKETKHLVIQDSIAKTLEAQGFQRCDSNQHLVYDYSSPGDSPGKCLNKDNKTPIKSPNKNISNTNICEQREKVVKKLPQISQAVTQKTPHRIVSPVKSSQSCEVLKLAAKYEMPRNSPKKVAPKDPAELSLADRKALFERGDGTAILPKAPFGMAIPPKLLRSDDNKTHTPLRKTPDYKRITADATSTRTISTPRNTPLSSKLEAMERPAVGDNVTREILERRREIEELRNRWDKKRKEVEDKLPDNSDVLLTTPTSHSKTIPVPPPLPVDSSIEENSLSPTAFRSNSHSPSKKERKTSLSPVVKTVLEGLKPIRLSPPKGFYPNVADIETDSEMMEEDRRSDLDTISEAGEDRISLSSYYNNEVQDSSMESENSAMSFGKHIIASSRENSRSNLKRPANVHSMSNPYESSVSPNCSDSSSEIPNDSTESSSSQNITADESKVLHEIDDFLDEALGEPTPPKKLKEKSPLKIYESTARKFSKSPLKVTDSKIQTLKQFINEDQHTPIRSEELNNHKDSEGSNTPLVHTISLYRKQQSTLIKTPIKRTEQAEFIQTVNDSPPEETVSVKESVKRRMEELQIEVKRQITIISQASQALNLCMSSVEFSGSTEELEAERLLLLASSRRMVATHELERITVEKKLHPKGTDDSCEDGTLKIESLAVKAKRIPSALDETIHLVCLVKCGCTVQATEIIPLTRQALTDNNRLVFKKPIQIEHIRHNQQTTVEVYSLTNKSFMHHLRGEINKDKQKMTPKKCGKKENKRHFAVESPAGPNAIRSTSFQLIGYVVFSLKDISRHHFTLNKVPGNAPIDGFLEMKVKGQVNLDQLHYEGFLTLFQEIGGFGAWKRAWCLLRGYHLSFCGYPDRDRALASCFETIDLSECITREVGLAPRDVCVRSDTVMLECRRLGKENEIIRYLLSADSLQERVQWCHFINKVLSLLRLWNPLNKV